MNSLEQRDEALLLSPKQTAELMDVSVPTVTAMCRSGKLPAVRIGKQWRIRRSDLLTFLGFDQQGGEAYGA